MNDSMEIRDNVISSSILGIDASGNNHSISKNILSGLKGTGIKLSSGNSSSVFQNMVYDLQEGVACQVASSGSLIYNNYFQAGGIGSSIGLKIDSGAINNQVYFNSINATGTNQFGSTALWINGAAGSRIQNNIFKNSALGSALTIQNPGAGLLWNNNCYYSVSGLLMYLNSSPVYSLDGIKTLLGQNTESISVNPYFNTTFDLSANHIALNGTAALIPGIDSDITGNLRGSLPDIGAKEISPCLLDAGVDRFVGLESPIPAGLRPIKVLLRNQGINPVSSLTINWSVNGVAQTPFQWTGQLSSASEEVEIGTYNFLSGVQVRILAYTVLNNDCNSNNDSNRAACEAVCTSVSSQACFRRQAVLPS
jgi:hypothetical protein